VTSATPDAADVGVRRRRCPAPLGRGP
jgi:hypothetical protein